MRARTRAHLRASKVMNSTYWKVVGKFSVLPHLKARCDPLSLLEESHKACKVSLYHSKQRLVAHRSKLNKKLPTNLRKHSLETWFHRIWGRVCADLVLHKILTQTFSFLVTDIYLLSKYGKQRLLISLHIVAKYRLPKCSLSEEYILEIRINRWARNSFSLAYRSVRKRTCL